MTSLVRQLWVNDDAQDVAEYAVTLAVIVLLVVATIKLITTGSALPSH